MEKKNRRPILIKYLVATLVGAALSLGIMYWRGAFTATASAGVYMAISDGFFVTAMLYICFGLLLLCSSTGCLDMLAYGFRSVLYLFTPMRRNRDEGGFYEYKQRRKQRRRPVPYFLIWIGLGFLVPAVVFVVLYSSVAA